MINVLEDLKKLKNHFYSQKEIQVGDIKLVIKLLSSEEELEIHSEIAKYEQGVAFIYALKKETICKAILEINGSKLDNFIKDGEFNIARSSWLKKYVIGEWPELIIDRIWDEYSKVFEEVENKVKSSIKREEVKETIENKAIEYEQK